MQTKRKPVSKYGRTYEALKRFGFSPFKAGEIILDAIRGDSFARQAVGVAFCIRHRGG